MAISVLVVDDNDFIRRHVSDALVGSGYTIAAEARDAKEAIEAYRTHKPSLVLMDMVMPGMNGLDAAREIFQINPSARVILCSSIDHNAMILDAIDVGVLDFVRKPIRSDELLDVIGAIVR